MDIMQVEELVLQALEHELGGVNVYSTAIGCALNPDLKQEWQEYLEQTKSHVRALQSVCSALGIDPQRETPGRGVVRHVGAALVEAMKLALTGGQPAAAELVACDCVVLAETKDHANWQLLGKCAENLDDAAGAALKEAYGTIEDQEDEHLYHTKGWCRELWIKSLGLPAVLPPPEEQQHVKTAMGAARAEQLGDKLRLESAR
jgi:ferritin-like metal-binding protein YciE